MEYLNVLAAAVAGFAMGALWYMTLAKPWMKAAGIQVSADGKPQVSGSPLPFVVAGIAMLLVAGMMRHVFQMAQMDTVLEGLMGGFGIGLFFIVPWMAMNYAYAMRPTMLAVIDGGYAVLGCTVIGLVLVLF
ncbi:DUF1761 domain-containing protein [Frigidibacter sp. ROC022]|uniref:DUF1761 domain-containing protein n=1 Tax=Frigidibacter sp. ROC022 TaxID=2971796 RepID=UPI00215B0D43|nr:DUF1761 domain-containing protein [Frigidibacter sp. ROC022]MCR8724504.1 DUF1761 domain-containing protein [Frigidibacter sp. ROC022]